MPTNTRIAAATEPIARKGDLLRVGGGRLLPIVAVLYGGRIVVDGPDHRRRTFTCADIAVLGFEIVPADTDHD